MFRSIPYCTKASLPTITNSYLLLSKRVNIAHLAWLDYSQLPDSGKGLMDSPVLPSLTLQPRQHRRYLLWLSSGKSLPLALFFFFFSAITQAAEPTFSISGATTEQEANIRGFLGKPRENCNMPRARERRFLRNSRADIEKALQALGFYHADIQLTIKRLEDCWRLDISVIANDPIVIDEIDITITGDAENDAAFAALKASLPIKPGDIMRHDKYEESKQALVRLAAERGYFDSKLTQQQLSIDVGKKTAAIHLHLTSGTRYFFGATHFEQDILHDDFLQRFIRFKEGDPFDNNTLLNLRQALSGSGYFNDVRIDARAEEHEDFYVPITITANPRPKYVYTAGIGFATDTGPRLRLGLENRRFNRSGHRYNTELELSPVRSGIGASYEVPLGDPNRERINFGTGYIREDVEDNLSERYRFRIAHLKELDSGWIATQSIDFEREYYTVASQTDTTDLIMPGYELARIRADNPIYPRNGWKLNGKVRFAAEELASSVSFIQFRGLAKWIFPTWYGRIITRIEAGVTIADSVTDLPSSVRFFAGGDSSIRGYAYQSLGPEDANGKVIGGRHFLTGTVEYDFPIAESWSLALFTDAGNAYDQWRDFNAVYGHGIGVRWRSPIGPIRFDLAHPTSGDDTVRIHVSMGMDL